MLTAFSIESDDRTYEGVHHGNGHYEGKIYSPMGRVFLHCDVASCDLEYFLNTLGVPKHFFAPLTTANAIKRKVSIELIEKGTEADK